MLLEPVLNLGRLLLDLGGDPLEVFLQWVLVLGKVRVRNTGEKGKENLEKALLELRKLDVTELDVASLFAEVGEVLIRGLGNSLGLLLPDWLEDSQRFDKESLVSL